MEELHRRLQAEAAPPSLLVGSDGDVRDVSAAAAPYLLVAPGAPTRRLLELVRPELTSELQAGLLQARRQGRPVETGAARVRIDGEERRVRLLVRPVDGADLTQVLFLELPPEAPPRQGEADPGARAAAAAAEELQLGRERLQVTVEEYETAREELRAQNEGLRSAVEELEGGKEEAQAMAEEFQAVNDELKRAVEEVSLAKGDLEHLVASADIATLFLDRDLRILRFTPRAGDLFDVREADRGRPISDLTHRLGYGALAEDAAAVLTRLAPLEREAADEAGRWYLTRVIPYRSPEERVEGVVLTFVDITERRQAEAALLQSERNLAAIFAHAAVGLSELSLAGRFLRANEALHRFMGRPPEALLGADVRAVTHPDDLPATLRAFQRLVETGEQTSLDKRYMRPDGGVVWAHSTLTRLDDEDGRPARVLAVTVDLTERKQAADALRASEARFRAAAETVPDILFTATPEGLVDYVNPRFEETTGALPEAALGTPIWPELMHPEDREGAQTAWEGALREETPYEHRHRLLTSDGAPCWHLSRARPVRDTGGRVTRWFGTCTDIDRIVRVEQEIQTLNATLEARVAERSEQVRALSRALTLAEQGERQRIAQVLHDDLQQMLVGAKMRLAAMAGERALVEDTARILDRSIALTRSLSTELAPPLLRGEDLEEALLWLAGRNREVHGMAVDVDVEPGCRVPDPSLRILLYQILRELLFNVVKHAGAERAAVRAWREGGEVRVTVEDRGAGFDLEAAAGGGFGLYHVRDRLELVGGRVLIESAPGEGTRVTVALPDASPEPGAA